MLLERTALRRRLLISAVAVAALTVLAAVATEGSGRSVLPLLLFLGIVFAGGFIGGSYWAIPTTIIATYAASALYHGGLNVPDPTEPDGDLFVIALLLFLTLLSGVIAAGVFVSKSVQR